MQTDLLAHHVNPQQHHSVNFPTTNHISYDVKKIKNSLSPNQLRYIFAPHAFTCLCCDTVSYIAGFSKDKLFTKLSSGDQNQHSDVFYYGQATHDTIKLAGVSLFKAIYNTEDLERTSYHKFSHQAKKAQWHQKHCHPLMMKPSNMP